MDVWAARSVCSQVSVTAQRRPLITVRRVNIWASIECHCKEPGCNEPGSHLCPLNQDLEHTKPAWVQCPMEWLIIEKPLHYTHTHSFKQTTAHRNREGALKCASHWNAIRRTSNAPQRKRCPKHGEIQEWFAPRAVPLWTVPGTHSLGVHKPTILFLFCRLALHFGTMMAYYCVSFISFVKLTLAAASRVYRNTRIQGCLSAPLHSDKWHLPHQYLPSQRCVPSETSNKRQSRRWRWP